MAEMHDATEEYLETILEIEEEGVRPIRARLVERLGLSAPAVSETVNRLVEQGYAELLDDRSLHLTPKGRALATTVVRRHRLAERLLTDVIGLPWHKAHVEACRWEHVISDEVEALLVEKLGHPTTCPHGNPNPGAGGTPPATHVLADRNLGDQVCLERVTELVELDQESLSYLSQHGFVPGTKATVASRAPDGTMILDLGAGTIALGPRLAQQLFVTAA